MFSYTKEACEAGGLIALPRNRRTGWDHCLLVPSAQARLALYRATSLPQARSASGLL
jgi:hypothetical protein